MTEEDGTIVVLRNQQYSLAHSERTGVDTLTFRDIYLGAVLLIECRLAVRSKRVWPHFRVDPAVIMLQTSLRYTRQRAAAVASGTSIPTRVFLPQHPKSPIVRL